MTVVLLVGVAVLVVVNGFFVGAEFALVKARAGRIGALASEGRRGARRAVYQIDHIDEYLAACQLGITMASLGIGFLGEPAIAELLEPWLGGFLSHTVAVVVAISAAYVIVTFAHITVGEQVPKIWSIVHAERAVLFVSAPLQAFYLFSKPLTWVLNSVSNAMLRLIGTDAGAVQHAHDEDVRLLIVEGTLGGKLDPREAAMLTGVVGLHQLKARQVMTPFHAVVTIPADASAREALDRCLQSGHTRIVVVDADTPDRILGVAHANSLASRVLDASGERRVADSTKQTLIVPETKPLDDLLADLQRDRLTLAIVADEYGIPVGIVTVEDIVEEIVGEIIDETDPAALPVRRLGNGDWIARGDTSIDDLRDYGIDLSPSDDYASVGGFVFHQLGQLPMIGDMARETNFSVRVESIRASRITTVRIRDHRGQASPVPAEPAA